jgi:hypothetical protein
VDRLVEGLHPEKIILSGSHARGTHAKLLDRHYIPTRDPDALPDLTPRDAFGLTDATEAIPAARGILVSVEELLERWPVGGSLLLLEWLWWLGSSSNCGGNRAMTGSAKISLLGVLLLALALRSSQGLLPSEGCTPGAERRAG